MLNNYKVAVSNTCIDFGLNKKSTDGAKGSRPMTTCKNLTNSRYKSDLKVKDLKLGQSLNTKMQQQFGKITRNENDLVYNYKSYEAIDRQQTTADSNDPNNPKCLKRSRVVQRTTTNYQPSMPQHM